MESQAERKLAAKRKLETLAAQRREEEARRRDKEAAKAARKAARQAAAAQGEGAEAASAEGAAPVAAAEAAEAAESRRRAGAAEGAAAQAPGGGGKRKAKSRAEAAPAKEGAGASTPGGGGKRKAAPEAEAAPAKAKRPKRGKCGRKEPLPIVPVAEPVGPLGADAYREANNIVCKNVECPAPLETFQAAQESIGEHLVQMLRDRGFLAPAPIQAQVWPLALGGQDVVGIAQTGSGKTLAYLLPALARLRERARPSTDSLPALPRVLVLAPTRELTQQIATETARLSIAIGHRFVPCFGGVWKGAQLRQLEKGCDILLSTPGRAKDFMVGVKEKGAAPAVSVKEVAYLVLDEADAMLSMGFMPQIKDIVRRCKKTGLPAQAFGAGGSEAGSRRQTLFFTATWPRRVRAAAKELTADGAAQLRIGQGVGSDKLTANKNVRQIVQVVERRDKLQRLINVLTSELSDGDTCIVFCSTRGRVDFVVDSLRREKVVDRCEGIHSSKEQWERDKILERFRGHTAAANKRAVLVATDVAARGIDIPGVALVVVYDLNGWNGELNIDSYVHRIGRTGRAGKMGRAYTFVDHKDRGLPDLVRLLKDAEQRVPIPLQEVEVGERLPVKARAAVAEGEEEAEESLPKARLRDRGRLASLAGPAGARGKRRGAAPEGKPRRAKTAMK